MEQAVRFSKNLYLRHSKTPKTGNPMKTFTRFFATVVAVLAFAGFASAQSFEGTIEFKKQSSTDTTNYVYYVKGPTNKVRLDEIGSKSKKVEGTFLVDLKEKKMTSLSHDRKLYMDKAQSAPATITGKPEVTKTKNTRTIQGYKCTEYIVKNKDENTQISYWIAFGKFDFFMPFLKLINQKQKFSTYYQQLTGVEGGFPMLAIESSMDGTERARLEVTKIEKKALDTSLFDIPKGYLKFEK